MTIGIVGYGSFGALTHTLLKRFAPEADIRVHSSRFEPDGKIFFSLEETAKSDALMLCVPIRNTEETLLRVLPHVRPDTILVDVATVKGYTTEIFNRVAAGRPHLSTHPMFGPESYEKKGKEVSGLRIVVTGHSVDEGKYRVLMTRLREVGFDVVETTPDEHDKHLAETLFLTHFVGQTISRAGFHRTEIDTVSFGYLMDAMESVRQDTELFMDVYRFNPYCEEVLKRFEASQTEVHAFLKKP
jgi:prephenate dehydrogenase